MKRTANWLQVIIVASLIIGTLMAWSPWLNAERAEAWGNLLFRCWSKKDN